MVFGRGTKTTEDPGFEIVDAAKSPKHQVESSAHRRDPRGRSTKANNNADSKHERSSSPRKGKRSASPQKTPRRSVSPRRRTPASPRNTVSSPRNAGSSPKKAAPSPRNAVSSPRNASSTPKNTVTSPKNIKSPRNAVGSPRSTHSRGVVTEKVTGKQGHPLSPANQDTSVPMMKSASTRSKARTAGVLSEPLLEEEKPAVGRSTHSRGLVYKPPQVDSVDSLDDIVSRIEQDNQDKYSTVGVGEGEDVESRDPSVSQPPESRYTRPNDTFMATAAAPVAQNAAVNRPISDMSTYSYGTEGETVYTRDEGTYFSEGNRLQPGKIPQREIHSMSSIDSERFLSGEEAMWSDDDYVIMKQRIAYLCILVSAVQLGVLLIQLILCGVAGVAVNPMIGPYPDAFSEWGGKNAYLMLEDHQYFRLITPAFLNVGLLHLLINVFCQLETCAFFEREWGSCRWLILYIISTIGCVATSSVFNPDDIAVCSSGAIMGLFGAKIAQVITWTAFDLRSHAYFDSAQLDQLGGVMCSAALVSMLSFVTYIEWSGHMGGFAAGFFAGMFMFCRPIASICSRLLWGFSGLVGLFGGAFLLGRQLYTEVEPDADLGDACQYFRNLYPEGYDCECVWN